MGDGDRTAFLIVVVSHQVLRIILSSELTVYIVLQTLLPVSHILPTTALFPRLWTTYTHICIGKRCHSRFPNSPASFLRPVILKTNERPQYLVSACISKHLL
jgi:hypothetical protein